MTVNKNLPDHILMQISLTGCGGLQIRRIMLSHEILQTRQNTRAARYLLTPLLKRQGLSPQSYDDREAEILLSSYTQGAPPQSPFLAPGSEQPDREPSPFFEKT